MATGDYVVGLRLSRWRVVLAWLVIHCLRAALLTRMPIGAKYWAGQVGVRLASFVARGIKIER